MLLFVLRDNVVIKLLRNVKNKLLIWTPYQCYCKEIIGRRTGYVKDYP